jgi:hypothetical protein
MAELYLTVLDQLAAACTEPGRSSTWSLEADCGVSILPTNDSHDDREWLPELSTEDNNAGVF